MTFQWQHAIQKKTLIQSDPLEQQLKKKQIVNHAVNWVGQAHHQVIFSHTVLSQVILIITFNTLIIVKYNVVRKSWYSLHNEYTLLPDLKSNVKA